MPLRGGNLHLFLIEGWNRKTGFGRHTYSFSFQPTNFLWQAKDEEKAVL
jgi:hypothetical protein